jgi:hypothetical protein
MIGQLVPDHPDQPYLDILLIFHSLPKVRKKAIQVNIWSSESSFTDKPGGLTEKNCLAGKNHEPLPPIKHKPS